MSQLIYKSILGKLSVAEKQQLEAWINASEKNKEIYESYQNEEKLRQDIAYFSDVDMSSSWARMKIKIRAEQQPIPQPKLAQFSWWFKMGSAAAALIIMGLIGFRMLRDPIDTGIVKDTTGLYHNDVLPGGSVRATLTLSDGKQIALTDEKGFSSGYDRILSDSRQPVGYQTLTVPKGSTFKIELADGSKVMMNSESELQFPVSFKGEKREVKLVGEAYFEVTKNKEQPFVIDVGTSQIEVLGTSFNVNATDRDTKTTLVEGSVKLSADKGMSTILVPGELGQIKEQIITKERVDLRKVLAWKNNEFYFHDDRFVDVLHQLALWYELDVVMDKGMGQMLISGSIDKNVKLSETLQMLKYVTNASFKIEGRKLTVMK